MDLSCYFVRVQASVTLLIIEFAGKSPDFVKGWPEKFSLHKLIPILEDKARYIFI